MATPISSDRAVSLRSKTVLILEDDATVADSLAEVLSDAGYGVERAHDGFEAIERFRHRGIPAAILLDLRTPRLSGAEFLAVVSEDERLRDVPIVACWAGPIRTRASLRREIGGKRAGR